MSWLWCGFHDYACIKLYKFPYTNTHTYESIHVKKLAKSESLQNYLISVPGIDIILNYTDTAIEKLGEKYKFSILFYTSSFEFVII